MKILSNILASKKSHEKTIEKSPVDIQKEKIWKKIASILDLQFTSIKEIEKSIEWKITEFEAHIQEQKEYISKASDTSEIHKRKEYLNKLIEAQNTWKQQLADLTKDYSWILSNNPKSIEPLATSQVEHISNDVITLPYIDSWKNWWDSSTREIPKQKKSSQKIHTPSSESIQESTQENITQKDAISSSEEEILKKIDTILTALKNADEGDMVVFSVISPDYTTWAAIYEKIDEGIWQHKRSNISAQDQIPISNILKISYDENAIYLDANSTHRITGIHLKKSKNTTRHLAHKNHKENKTPVTTDTTSNTWEEDISTSTRNTVIALPYKKPEKTTTLSKNISTPSVIALPYIDTSNSTAVLENTNNTVTTDTEDLEDTEKNETREWLKNSLDIASITRVRSIDANIADVSKNLEDIALTRADERLREEQSKANIFKRFTRIFNRAKRREQYRLEELEKLQNEHIFDISTRHIRENASERFGRENTLYGNTNIERIDAFTNDMVNTWATKFVHGEIDATTFEEEFEKLILDWWFPISVESIKHRWTDILKKLIKEREYYIFLRDMPYDENSILNALMRAEISPRLQEYIERSTGKYLKTDKDSIVAILGNTEARNIVLNQTIEVSIEVLKNGKAAFEIDNSNNTQNATYKIGKFLQKHPLLSSLATGMGITASSIAMGPIGNIITGTFGVGTLNWLRRNAEYTDEHAGFEKRITEWTYKDASIYREIESLQNSLTNSRWVSKLYHSYRLRKAQKKLKLYQLQGVKGFTNSEGSKISTREGTTHRHFAPISALNRKLQAYINEDSWFELEGENADLRILYFKNWISQALARLDAYQKSGHNFLKSNSQQEMEGDMNILGENIFLSLAKLDITLEDIRNSESYKKAYTILLNDYNRAHSAFISSRTSTSLSKAVKHGALYGWSALIFQWLSGTGIFLKEKFVTDMPTVSTGGLTVDTGIAQELKQTLWTAKYQEFLNNISNNPNPNTLWDTISRDIFSNPHVGNKLKNEIMTYILNATDIQNGVSKPSLLIEAANNGIFNDIANKASSIDRVVSLLHKWWYTDVKKQWLIDTIRGIDSGSITVSSLSPKEQTKIAEALWCYVHKDWTWAWSPLWQVFMDRLPDVITPGTKTAIKPNILEKIGIFGIPTWRNTFLSTLKTSKTSHNTPSYSTRRNIVDIPSTTNTSDIQENIKIHTWSKTSSQSEIETIDADAVKVLKHKADATAKKFFEDYPNLEPKLKATIDWKNFYFPPVFDEKIIFFVENNWILEPRVARWSNGWNKYHIFPGYDLSKTIRYSKWDTNWWLDYEAWVVADKRLVEIFNALPKSTETIQNFWGYLRSIGYTAENYETDEGLDEFEKINLSNSPWEYSPSLSTIRYWEKNNRLGDMSKYSAKVFMKKLFDHFAFNADIFWEDIHWNNFTLTNPQIQNLWTHQNIERYSMTIGKAHWENIVAILAHKTDDSPELYWIEEITLDNSPITSYWIPKHRISSGLLTVKPYEYGAQIPEFIKKDMRRNNPSADIYLDESYDIREYIQDNPIIREFKKIQWL